MSYLPADRIERIRARIAAKEAALADLDAAFADAASHVQSYRLTSGDGSTSAEYRSLHEIRNNIRILEKDIEHLYQILGGTGIVNFKLRRNS